MGRCRSHESMEYREKIMEALCANKRIVNLLTPESYRENGEVIHPAKLQYKFIMPCQLVEGTLTEKGRYLGFDLSIYPNKTNIVYKSLQLDFFILCENDPTILRFMDPDIPNHYRLWHDLVICELDEMFCGENYVDVGVGRWQFVANIPKTINYQRELPYIERIFSVKIDDWIDGEIYGK